MGTHPTLVKPLVLWIILSIVYVCGELPRDLIDCDQFIDGHGPTVTDRQGPIVHNLIQRSPEARQTLA